MGSTKLVVHSNSVTFQLLVEFAKSLIRLFKQSRSNMKLLLHHLHAQGTCMDESSIKKQFN